MERPLEDKRPVGPFAQSAEFRDKLLGGNQNDQELLQGDVLLVEILGGNVTDAMRGTDDIIEVVEDFVVLEEIGNASGQREQITPGRDVGVGILYYYVDLVHDTEVTIGQVQEFIEQELQGGPVNIFEVNIVKM